MSQPRDPRSTRPEKKSEMLEIRLSWSEKRALVRHCRESGVSASALVRGLIDQQLKQPAWRRFLNQKGHIAMPMLKRFSPAAAGLATVALAGSLALAVAAPSTASDYRATFDALDLDADGQVTLDEFLSLSDSELLPVGARYRGSDWVVTRRELEGEMRQEFALYDRNRNGQMTYAEFTGRYGSLIEATFEHFDSDADGRLSAAELNAGMALEPGNGADLVAEFDTDRDGLLSFAEFTGSTG